MEISVLDDLFGTPEVPVKSPITDDAALVLRPLIGKDLAALKADRKIKSIPIKALRTKHHNLARLLATGTEPGRAGMICGYAASYVSILQSDPTFKNLVRMYRDTEDALHQSMREKLADVSNDALQEIQDRLEDKPESFSVPQLLELVTKTADRSGHGPSSSQEINVNNSADILQAARLRVMEAEKTIIDVTPNDRTPNDK